MDFLPDRDGLFTGLHLLELIVQKDKPLSEIIKEIFKEYGEAYYKMELSLGM